MAAFVHARTFPTKDVIVTCGTCGTTVTRTVRRKDPAPRFCSRSCARRSFYVPPRPVDELLVSHVLKTDGCWYWTGRISRHGYGVISRTLSGVVTQAHRLVYEALVGQIPDGLTLDHLCHTQDAACVGGTSCPHRRCVNPSHLEPVTVGENSLRGSSSPAVNARKTHCKRGHPFDDANTYLAPGQRPGRFARNCRACHRDAAASQRMAKKAQQGESRGEQWVG